MKINKSIIVLVILLIIAGAYFFSNSKGSLSRRNSSFEINSTDITKIQISTPNETLLLEKLQNQWKVNSKYKATDKSIGNFLLAINRITASAPVSNAEKEQIASILSSDGIVVEVFKKNKTIKKYYVSKPGMNKNKTYMMMYNSSEPFVVRIPSFKGLVADLFIIDENYWRDKSVFNYQPQNISSIIVEYPENQSKSFKAINYNNGTFAIQNLENKAFVDDFNIDKLAMYFTYFQRIVFDDVVKNIGKIETDSVFNSNPFCIITVEDIQGVSNKIATYRKPSAKGIDEFGQKIKFDYDKAYATLNNNKELVTIQYYNIDLLLKEIDYFR